LEREKEGKEEQMIISECCESWVDIPMAKEMIKVCHEINPEGLVKFQLHDPEDKGFTQWTKSHALSFDQAKELFDYGASIGQEVFFSVFAPIYVDWCEKIGVKRYKLAAGFWDGRGNTWDCILITSKPSIISTFVSAWKAPNVSYDILWCPQGYPCAETYLKHFHFFEPITGFSDHTIGLDAAKIALARGAKIIEKHFVLEHNPDYPDDAWSMTPSELKELVRWEKSCQEVLV
jgi:sialic acid synthase SpsE